MSKRYRLKKFLFNTALNSLLYLREYSLRLERAGVPDQVNTLLSDATDLFNDQALLALSDWIKARLRRVPYWVRGHARLARVSFDRGDIALAYASAQAVKQLANSGPDFINAKFVLGRCYLKKGVLDTAAQIFEELLKEQPQNSAFKAELAACCIGTQNYTKAQKLLLTIPATQITPSSKAALQFVESKIRNYDA